jgi:RpiR family carbohydrate utilization transcriptional regulator
MLVQIRQKLDSLSRTEQKVGAWILEHPRQAAGATLREVAAASGASEPTVVRFCRHVGVDGFRELTRRLTEALSRPASVVHAGVTENDALEDAVSKVLDTSIQALLDLRGDLGNLPLERAVAAMAAARQIAFAGFGASGHVASDAQHKFFRLGIPCSVFTDAPGLIQFAAIAVPKDVLVIASHTGTWPALTEAARLARSRGVTVIAVTGPRSPLAGEADILIPCRVREDTSIYTPMSSRLAQLALFDALQTAVALELGAGAVEHLSNAKRALADIKPNLIQNQ